MKRLHRNDLYGWSVFDESRNIDFHSVLWHRPSGNVVVDPLPMSHHDHAHLDALGGAKWIVITNSDHVRDAANLTATTGADIMGPKGESATFPLQCRHWLVDGAEVVPGLEVLELQGSKTPGELSLVLEETTLVTGDLVRCHQAGRLCLLPDKVLANKAEAIESVRRLSLLPRIEAVLVGDGWPLFRGGGDALRQLVAELDG
jgi:glyoxylase-like metal-dependent hydrolase (beta-lactamase superfamily II)